MRANAQSTRKAERGSSFIELLLAISVLTISYAGVSTLAIGGIRANTETRYINAASHLAEDKLEEIRSWDYANIGSGADPAGLTPYGDVGGSGSANALEEAIFNRSWSVGSGPAAGTKEVAVTVAWTVPSPRQVVVRTLIAE